MKLLMIILCSIVLTGCPLDGDKGSRGEQGPPGQQGVQGPQGVQGERGINCWDTNENGINDPNEDTNGDGVWSVGDCFFLNAGVQHPEAQYNFQHFCEAFANLGQYPKGCPSSTHTPPTGNLIRMIPGQFDSSYQTCSDLSITVEGNNAFWTLEGGFIANSQVLPIQDRDSCRSLCENDSRCVASEWHLRAGLGSGDCQLYYHSDSLTVAYKRQCGVDVPGIVTAAEACLLALGSDTVWYALCP